MKMESNVSTSRFVTTAAAHAAGTSYKMPENHQKHAKNRSFLEAFQVYRSSFSSSGKKQVTHGTLGVGAAHR